MAVVKNLMVRAGMDATGVVKGTKKAKGTLYNFHKSISRTMKGIGLSLGALGIARFVKSTTEAYDEQMQQEVKLATVMRQRMGATNEMIASIKELTVAQQQLGIIGDEVQLSGAQQLSTFLRTSDSLKTLIPAMNNLAAQQKGVNATGHDLVSIANMMGRVLEGNTGALRRVGVSFTEAEQRMLKYGNEQERANVLAQIITNNVGNMNEALASTPQGRWQQVKNEFGDLREEIGRAFVSMRDLLVPSLLRVISWLNVLATRLNQVTTFVTTFTNALFGRTKQVSQQTNAINGQIGAIEGIGDAYEESAKQARKSTAGFDEINQLAEPVTAGVITTPETDIGGIGGSLEALESIDLEGVTNQLEKVSEKAQKMGESVRNAFESVRKTIETNKTIITASLGGILGSLVAVGSFKGFLNLKKSIGLLKGALGGLWGTMLANPLTLKVALIGALIGALVFAYKKSDTFREKLTELWTFVKEKMNPMFEAMGKVAIWVYREVFVPFGSFLKLFNYTVLKPLSNVVGEILVGAFNLLFKAVEKIWLNAFVPLGRFLATVLIGTLKTLQQVFLTLWDIALKPIASFILDRLVTNINKLSDTFMFLYEKVLRPIAIYLSGVFLEVLDDVLDGVRTVIQGMEHSFNGIMNFITGIFKGDWKKAWEGVRDIFKGIFDSLYGIAKVPLNLIITAIKKVIDGLSQLKINIPDWVPGFGGKGFGINIPKIPKLAQGGITDVNNPFMAIVGDNRTQKEVVAPLDDLMGMITSAVGTALMGANQFKGDTQQSNSDIVLNLDGVTMARVMNPLLAREQQRLGKNMIVKPV